MATSENRQPPVPGSKRQRLREEQARAAKERKIRAIITYSIAGVALAAVITVIAWVAIATNGTQATVASSAGSATGSSQYVVTAGTADAAVTLDIYQDFMCPYCGQFERTNRADLISIAESGKVAIRIHPMSFLDDSSQGTKYSTRAANALFTVAKAEPAKALAFNEALYTNQPSEGTTGLTDAQIASIAVKAGVSEATAATFSQLKYTSLVTGTTSEANSAGITSTPTVLINGTKFSDVLTQGALKTAVDKAVAAK